MFRMSNHPRMPQIHTTSLCNSYPENPAISCSHSSSILHLSKMVSAFLDAAILQDLQNYFCSSDLFPSAQSHLSDSLIILWHICRQPQDQIQCVKPDCLYTWDYQGFFIPARSTDLLWLSLQSWRSWSFSVFPLVSPLWIYLPLPLRSKHYLGSVIFSAGYCIPLISLVDAAFFHFIKSLPFYWPAHIMPSSNCFSGFSLCFCLKSLSQLCLHLAIRCHCLTLISSLNFCRSFGSFQVLFVYLCFGFPCNIFSSSVSQNFPSPCFFRRLLFQSECYHSKTFFAPWQHKAGNKNRTKARNLNNM